jgi:hypothetical protein
MLKVRLILLIILLASVARGQKNNSILSVNDSTLKKTNNKPDKSKNYKDLIPPSAITQEGLIKVHQTDGGQPVG